MRPGRKPESASTPSQDSERVSEETGGPPKSSGVGGLRQMGDLLSMGWNLALSIGVGLTLGVILDRWLDTRPWGILIFLLLGVAAGFVSLFRTAIRLGGKDDGADSTTNANSGADDG